MVDQRLSRRTQNHDEAVHANARSGVFHARTNPMQALQLRHTNQPLTLSAGYFFVGSLTTRLLSNGTTGPRLCEGTSKAASAAADTGLPGPARSLAPSCARLTVPPVRHTVCSSPAGCVADEAAAARPVPGGARALQHRGHTSDPASPVRSGIQWGSSPRKSASLPL